MKRSKFSVPDNVVTEFQTIIQFLRENNVILQSDEEAIESFLKNGTNPDLMIGKNRTPIICLAVMHQKRNLFYYLLQHGANINARDFHGNRSLFASMKFQGSSCIQIEDLLQNGASLTTENGYGLTPLCWAAKKGFKHAIEALLKYGADVNYNNGPYTPLGYAILNTEDMAIKILCAAGASPIKIDNSDNTAFHLAANQKEATIETLITRINFKEDNEITNKIKTTLLVFNRLSHPLVSEIKEKNFIKFPILPRDIQFYIFSKLPEYHCHKGLYKQLKNDQSRPYILYLMDNHIEYLIQILNIQNNYGQTARQRIPQWLHPTKNIQCLLDGSKLQKDLKILNELYSDIEAIPKNNLTVQILKNHYSEHLQN